MSPIEHILVATDLTDRSERAISRAVELQQRLVAALTILHVVEPGLVGNLSARRRGDAEAFLEARIAALPEEVRGRCSHAVVVGDAFSTITSTALARTAGLIVLGEPNKYRYVDLFVGTTTERVVRATPIPVLVVKGHTPGPYEHLLAPFDLSEGAAHALRTALTIAPSAEVRILHAAPHPVAVLSPGAGTGEKDAIRTENDAIRAQIESVTREASACSNRPAGALSIDIVEGNAFTILRNESSWPDLLAMGTHGRAGQATGMVGSLARHMLAEAPCDVLVARP